MIDGVETPQEVQIKQLRKDLSTEQGAKKLRDKVEGMMIVNGDDIDGEKGEYIREIFPDIDILGAGAESIVFLDPKNPDKVIALPWDEYQRPRGLSPFAETYHIHKILNILCPDNFPNIHYVKGLRGRESVREFVDGPSVVNLFYLDGAEESIERDANKLGLSIRLDKHGGNFIVSDGNLFYIDFVYFYIGQFNPKIELIEERLNQIDSSASDKLKVMVSLRRLSEIKYASELFTKYDPSLTLLEELLKDENFVDFVFDNNNPDDPLNSRSRKRIKTLVEKAIKTERDGKWEYKDNAWYRK